MPKNKYLIEREAFDCEREIHHRRRFKALMKSILRNQNRKFKLLMVIGYYKLLSNTLLISKAVQSSSSPKNFRQRGDSADSIRRNMLYAMRKPSIAEFPYNIPADGKIQKGSISNRSNWVPDDGSQILTAEQQAEQKSSRERSEDARRINKSKRSQKRLASIPELRKTLYSSNSSNDIPAYQINREDAFRRNLLVAETLPSRSFEGKRRKSIKPPEVPTVAEIVKNMCSIYSTFRDRTIYKALLRWMSVCRNKGEGAYLREIENVNIVLTERTFRERMFRTKVRLMHEAIESQIKHFEEQIKSHT